MPTNCSKCGVVIKLGTDGHTRSGDQYWCEVCAAKEMGSGTPNSSRTPRSAFLS